MSDGSGKVTGGTVTADDVAALAGVSRWTVGARLQIGRFNLEEKPRQGHGRRRKAGLCADLLAAALHRTGQTWWRFWSMISSIRTS